MDFKMKLLIFVITFTLPLTLTAGDRYHIGHRSARSADLPEPRARGNEGVWDNTDWYALANRELQRALDTQAKIKHHKAKNVIMFIGDGMGVSTIAAARLYNAESRGLKQEEIYLSWEKFPHVGLSRTYNVDRATPDSAGTGTAYLCGVKANMETIGVSDKVKFGDCSAVTNETKVRSIVKESIAAGKWTGIVTTTRITHASPAAGYAHVSDRDWEAYMPRSMPGQVNCDDIAKQLITDEENQHIRVILGGGRRMFLPNVTNQEYNNDVGNREDGIDLIKEWKARHPDGHFVMNNTQFNDVDPDKTHYLLGLFNRDHMQYEAQRTANLAEPSLAEMTEKAIRILQHSDQGYFLFVEGGRIDHSHHDSSAFKALNDTVAMSDAVHKAVELTSENDTLIVVTADHSHVFTVGGYGTFKTSVFDVTDDGLAFDQKPFLQLHYANGPGFHDHRNSTGSETARLNLTSVDTGTVNFKQDTAVPLSSETHGGEDVAIFASGPMAHLIHGVHEQNYIARVMMYASCVGKDLGGHCTPQEATTHEVTQVTQGINSACVLQNGGKHVMFSLAAVVAVLFALF